LYYDAALRSFFCNYLKDILKKPDTQIWLNSQSLEQKNSEDTEDGVFSSTLKDALEAPVTQNELLLLQEVKLSIEQVQNSARNFLQEIKETKRLYLTSNVCPDKDMSISLFSLKNIHNIKDYHNKARQLGITRKKGVFEKGYEKTLLGAWFVSLGLFPKKENIAEIEIALKILCYEALLLVDEKQNS
jgi:hypothetical protein